MKSHGSGFLCTKWWDKEKVWRVKICNSHWLFCVMVGTCTPTFLHLFKLCSECSSQLLRPCDSSTVDNTQLRHTVLIQGTISEDICKWCHTRTNFNHRSFAKEILLAFLEKGNDCHLVAVITFTGENVWPPRRLYGRFFKCKYTKPKQIKNTLSISHYMWYIL